METKAFACYHKDDAIRRRSSSGGIYSLFAEHIIASGGVVYAAIYEGTEVKHTRLTRIEEIEASCGSKYIPSRLDGIFSQVIDDLKNGKNVLFVGTPCQCGGLLALTGERDNLYCIDFICHGMPSKQAWLDYQKSLEKRGFKLASVKMRDKHDGWKNYNWHLTDCSGRIVIEHHWSNAFMRGFLHHLYLRPACYECRFKGIDRPTDLTLGDYWGVQHVQPEMDDNKGTSLVLVHSEKGKALFDRLSDRMVCADAPLQAAAKYNRSLTESANMPPERAKYQAKMKAGGDFISVVERLLKPSLISRIKGKLKRTVKRLIGRK